MSQAGEINIIENHPEIPTQFDANVGFAVPVANIINIVGGTDIETVGAGSTVTINFIGSVGVETFAVDAHTAPGTDPVLPDGSGVVTITGAQVAAGVVGANVIRTDSLAANTFTIEIQRSTTAALSTVAANGVCHFDSADFSVDANGFVTLSGSGSGQTITGNSGGALSPTAGNWNILGTGSLSTSGAGSTLTAQLTGLTNHNVLVGAGTATITNVAPSATTGIPLVSNGVGADPSFTTAVVAGGGTGVTTMTTAYAPVCAGTTATGPLQVASTGLATAGYVLTSNGNAAVPSFQATSSPAASCQVSAWLSATQSNVTGNAAVYQIVFDSEFFDSGGNYDNATGVFTAPANGKYFVSTFVYVTGIDLTMTFGSVAIAINAGALGSFQQFVNPSLIRDSNNQGVSLYAARFVELTAGQTISIFVQLTGGASDSADVFSSGNSQFPWTTLDIWRVS